NLRGAQIVADELIATQSTEAYAAAGMPVRGRRSRELLPVCCGVLLLRLIEPGLTVVAHTRSDLRWRPRLPKRLSSPGSQVSVSALSREITVTAQINRASAGSETSGPGDRANKSKGVVT